MGVDVEGGRLFVAALGADSLVVIDLRAGKRAARIAHVREPQGVAWPESGRLFVAIGSGGVQAFSLDKDLASAGAAGVEEADNLRLDPRAKLLCAGYGRALAAIDPDTMRITQTIELSGHPESFQLDEPSQQLFVATRNPALLLAYDLRSGRELDRLPICGHADDLFVDVSLWRLYLVCGKGPIQVVRRMGSGRLQVAERVTTAPDARTGLFVPRLTKLFVAVPSRRGSVAEIRVYKTR
jgi:hypothetical protein